MKNIPSMCFMQPGTGLCSTMCGVTFLTHQPHECLCNNFDVFGYGLRVSDFHIHFIPLTCLALLWIYCLIIVFNLCTVKDAYDYQGRSYLHIPQDVGINLRSADTPDKCYLPKKQLHVWTGHTKVTSLVRLRVCVRACVKLWLQLILAWWVWHFRASHP